MVLAAFGATKNSALCELLNISGITLLLILQVRRIFTLQKHIHKNAPKYRVRGGGRNMLV